MEHQLWRSFEQRLAALSTPFRPRCTFQDKDIVRVYYWAVLHDRPTCWACSKDNWPPHARKRPLPSPATVCRRLRSPAVLDLLRRLERAALCPGGDPPLLWLIDGKGLPIGGASTDRQAGYGKAAGGKAKGYKLHALVGCDGSVPIWRLAPMNTDERVMARRMLRQAEVQGYVVGDAAYDDNPLHDVCLSKGQLQLVTPRRYKKAKGLGHHRHSPCRLRSLAILDSPCPEFGRGLRKQRQAIERYFGNLTSFGGGLAPLPAWVRTYRRVRRWVQAKLIFNALRMQLRDQTYVA
jgi:Transposase DDE domain